MKLPAVISLMGFLAVTPIWAQSQQNADSSQHQASKSQRVVKKRINISGEVSGDGRTFTADSDSKIWQVSNPDALRGIYGRHVTIRGNVTQAKNEIHVLTVRAFGDERTSVKLDDAAFRR
jgi:hypothetical protein